MSYTPGPLPEPQKQVYCSHPDNIGNTWTTWRPAAADYFTAEQLSAHTAAEVARAVAAERERLAAEMEALRVDALRYRWLRDDAGASAVFSAAYWNTDTPADFDAAIDAELDPQRLQGKGE